MNERLQFPEDRMQASAETIKRFYDAVLRLANQHKTGTGLAFGEHELPGGAQITASVFTKRPVAGTEIAEARLVWFQPLPRGKSREVHFTIDADGGIKQYLYWNDPKKDSEEFLKEMDETPESEYLQEEFHEEKFEEGGRTEAQIREETDQAGLSIVTEKELKELIEKLRALSGE